MKFLGMFNRVDLLTVGFALATLLLFSHLPKN